MSITLSACCQARVKKYVKSGNVGAGLICEKCQKPCEVVENKLTKALNDIEKLGKLELTRGELAREAERTGRIPIDLDVLPMDADTPQETPASNISLDSIKAQKKAEVIAFGHPLGEPASLPIKQQYVIGFLFNYCAETVLLINKNRPAWQKGKLNGVGGHVEKGESPADAMKREFKEEAGLVLEWEYFCTMVFPDCEVHCYRHIDKSGHQIEVEPQTDEYTYWYSYRDLPSNVIPNLNWLIPMALQKEEYMTSVITRLEAV